ncbi:MAG: hypothetical protein ACXWK6_00560 [Myxococcaceae bacterium]
MPRLLAVLALLAARPLLAGGVPVTYQTAHGAREVAMGGTFREMGIGANSADGNPAAIAIFQAFQLEFAGGWSWQTGGWYGATWARDSTNPELAGAVGVHYLTENFGAGSVSQLDTSIAIAARLGDRVAFGLGTEWIKQTSPNVNAASLNLGISILVLPQMTLGFAAYNIIPTHNPQLARSFEVGFGLLVGPVRVGSEIRSDIGQGPLHPIWNSGVELWLGQAIALRGGWEWQELAHQNFLSSGLGFVFGTVGLDVGWRHGLSGAGDLMVFGLRILVQ